MALSDQTINDCPEELQKYFHQMSISSEFEIIGSSHIIKTFCILIRLNIST